MIDKGADVTDHHTMICALLLPSHRPALLMLQAGAALRPDPELLQRCTKNGFEPVLDLILARGANPNAGCVRSSGEPFAYRANGITPLMSAFLNGALPCAESLLRAGADPLVVSQVSPGTGVTVLSYAQSPEAISLLFRYLTDPIARGKLVNWFDPPYMLTPLHGALINACTASVSSPPEVALRLFEVLVEAGGDVGVKDKEGRDLLAFAQQRGASVALTTALTSLLDRFQSK